MAHSPKPGVDGDTQGTPLHADGGSPLPSTPDTADAADTAETPAEPVEAAAPSDANEPLEAASVHDDAAAPAPVSQDATETTGDDAPATEPIHEPTEAAAEESAPEDLLASFDELDLPPPLRRAIEGLDWAKPTPVQARAFAPLCEGRDVLVQSQTGSGKTGAFCIPWLAGRFENRPARETGVQLLVLVPTRELAKQVCGVLTALGEHSAVTPLPIYGGTAMQPQLIALREGVHAVVGTPGRILDHIRRRTLDLSKVRTVVLDEADEMLSMGFLEDIHAILEACPPPAERQTCLFSATVPPDIERIARRSMRDPINIRLSGDRISAEEIGHNYYTVSGALRTRDLLDIIALEEPASALVFCNTREETNIVANVLQREGYTAAPLSSDLSQAARERVLGWMRSGQLRFLVATDVASRGIDISHISHVINYTFPENAESYIHRTGRTGRAGRAGQATSLIGPQDLGNFYYLKLQYPTLRFEEHHLPSKEELERQRAENKLDHVSKLFPDLVSPEWTLLARNLIRDPRGEQVIACLLSQAVTQKQQEAARLRPEEDIEAGLEQGFGGGRERFDRGGRRGRGRRDERGEAGPRDRAGRSRRGREPRRAWEDDEPRLQTAEPEHTHAPEHEADAPVAREPEHVEEQALEARGLDADEPKTFSHEEGRRRRRRRRNRRGAEGSVEPGDEARASDAEDSDDAELAAAREAEADDAFEPTQAAADASSAEGEEEQGRRRKRRRRRRRGGRAPEGAPESADAPDDAVAAAASEDGESDTEGGGRKRRRRRRRNGSAAAAATEVVPHVPQDQIIIDIDENELEIVRGEFGEIDELDDLTLKGRRRGVMDALEEEVELEDVSGRDGERAGARATSSEQAPTDAAPSEVEAADETASEDQEAEGETETAAAATEDEDERAKRKRKRRRKRSKKKAEEVAVTPELSAPPHKDFWEVWASHFSYQDFEDEALGEDFKVDEELPPAPVAPLPEVDDGAFVALSLNCGRKHGKKAADIRELLATRVGLEGRCVRNLTVSDGSTMFRVSEAHVQHVQQVLEGLALDDLVLSVTLLEQQGGDDADDTRSVESAASNGIHDDARDARDDETVATMSSDTSIASDGTEASSDAPVP